MGRHRVCVTSITDFDGFALPIACACTSPVCFKHKFHHFEYKMHRFLMENSAYSASPCVSTILSHASSVKLGMTAYSQPSQSIWKHGIIIIHHFEVKRPPFAVQNQPFSVQNRSFLVYNHLEERNFHLIQLVLLNEASL